MDDDVTQEKIFALAQRFRDAIDRCKPNGLEGFPHDRCGETCQLLGAYLKDNGVSGFVLVEGAPGGVPPSHAWLERDGLIVDITVDQYDDVDETVIVTRQSAWHSAVVVHHSEGIADYREVNETSRLVLDPVYRTILKHV